MRHVFCGLIAAGLLGASPVVLAQSAPAQSTQTQPTVASRAEQQQMDRAMDRLRAVLNGGGSLEDTFTPEFINAIPEAQIRALAAQLAAAHGAVGSQQITPVSARTGNVEFKYDKAIVLGQFGLDPAQGWRIAELLITGTRVEDDSFSAVIRDIDALPGRAGFALVRLDGPQPATIAVAGDEAAYPIGSIFKLYVLDELAHQVASGRLKWSDVVPVNSKSFPSGILQKWPDNTPVTVGSAAVLMISISDNTAADLLINLAGREAIEARIAKNGHSAPERMLPFLTTIEAFALKMPQNADLQARFLAASEADQRRILESERARLNLAAINVALIDSGKPMAVNDIEWFANHADLVELIDRLSRHQDPMVRAIMAVNPGLPAEDARRWRYAGYKGGSEPGVIAASWLLEAADGRRYALVGGWTDAERSLDNNRFITLLHRVAQLAQEAR